MHPDQSHSVLSSFSRLFFRRPNLSNSLSSDDDVPGLSHSWSESSVEESDQISDLIIAPFSNTFPSPISTTTNSILEKSPATVVLSNNLSLDPTPNFYRASELSATEAELCRYHSGQTSCNPDTSELAVSLDHNYSQNHKYSNNHQNQNSDISQSIEQAKQGLPKAQQTLRSNFRQHLVPIDSQPSHSDLMGNKLAKLKNKNLGEILSFSNHHEDIPKTHTPESRNASNNYNNAKSHLSNSRSKPIQPFLNPPVTEKTPDIPTKSASRVNNSSVKKLDSKPASNSTSTDSAHSSGSITRTLTILTPVSSETLTLPSESALQLPSKQNSLPDISRTKIPCVSIANLSYPQESLSQIISEAKLVSSPLTEHTVLPGLPLNIIQLDCYQNHRSMRRISNKLYPVGCMVCQKMDAETRWTCTWCYLSACANCTHLLKAIPGNNLRVCLEKLESPNSR